MGRPVFRAAGLGRIDPTELFARPLAMQSPGASRAAHRTGAGRSFTPRRRPLVASETARRRRVQAGPHPQHGKLRRQPRRVVLHAVCPGYNPAGERGAHPRLVHAMSLFDALFSTSICYGAGSPEAGWTLALPITLPLAAVALVYAIGACRLWRRSGRGRALRSRHALLFAAGWAVLAAALVSPIHALGERVFAAHM